MKKKRVERTPIRKFYLSRIVRMKRIEGCLHGVRDSNPRPSVLETDILPTKLTPCAVLIDDFALCFNW